MLLLSGCGCAVAVPHVDNVSGHLSGSSRHPVILVSCDFVSYLHKIILTLQVKVVAHGKTPVMPTKVSEATNCCISL